MLNDEELKDLSGNEWTTEHKNIIKLVCYKTGLNVNHAISSLNVYSGNYKKLIEEHERSKIVGFVMRQTDYDIKTAYSKLNEYNGDYNGVILNYLGGNVKPEKEVKKSTNQMIFGEIRNFMDNTKIENDTIKNQKQKDELIAALTKKAINKDSK